MDDLKFDIQPQQPAEQPADEQTTQQEQTAEQPEAPAPAPAEQPAEPTLLDMVRDIPAQVVEEAKLGWTQILARFPDLRLGAEQADDVRWAIQQLILVSLARIGRSGVTPEMEQARRDAMAVFLNVAELKVRGGERLARQVVNSTVSRMLTAATGVIAAR